MDYEKKYKDALAHAREIHCNEEGKRKDMEFLFPELAESEDERIKKEIVEFLRLPHPQFVGKRNHEEWIDWLEKQGEKPQGKSALEAINEENVDNANKVEPKFKIEKDKWYVCTQTFVLSGKEVIIKGKTYQADDKDNVIKGEDGCRFVDRHDGKASDYLRSWTIQDAKDGDVLVSRSPFIYGKQCPYGGLNWCNNKFIKASNFIFTDSPVHPATKEQREQLEKAMADAGYTFDFEKKEFKLLISNGGDFVSNNCEQKPTDEEMKEALRTEYEKGRADAIAEMQVAWSEEDENTLKVILEELEKYIIFKQYSTPLSVYDLQWLKSIRPQKPPTNEEIEQAKKEYRDVALSKVDYILEELTYDDGWDDAISYMKKSLRPQNG